MLPAISTISGCPPATDSNGSRVIARGSTAFESTTSGASASCGPEREQIKWSSLTTTEEAQVRTMGETDRIEPVHPGEILMEDFIEGFDITQNKLAVSIGVSPRRINEIVHGKRGITADTAIRLARYFGTSAEFWMNLQAHYELRTQVQALESQLSRIVPIQQAS